MGKVDLVMKRWEKQLEEYDALDLKSARELYKKAVATDNETLKKTYMNKLILGTLYVPYNFILNNGLTMFSTGTYDINDIIAACNEAWINKLYEGKILEIPSFSYIFSGSSYFSDVYTSLSGDKPWVFDRVCLTKEVLERLFTKFIELKNSGNEASFRELVDQFYESDMGPYKVLKNEYYSPMKLFENIYQNLDFDKDIGLNIAPTRIDDYIQLLVDMGTTEKLPYDLATDSIEDDIIKSVVLSDVTADITTAIDKPRDLQMLVAYYGLNSDEDKTFREIGETHGVTYECVRMVIEKNLKKLPKKMKKYRWK